MLASLHVRASLLRLLGGLAVLTAPSWAHVNLLEPSGGEVLPAGTTFTIEWQVHIQHNTQNWDLRYSTLGPSGPWTDIAINLPPGDITTGAMHSYDWTVPDTPSSTVYVQITQDNLGSGDYTDVNNSAAEIVGLPSATVYGCGINPAGSMSILSGSPAIGGSITFGIDNPVGSTAIGSFSFVFISDSPDPSYPCGTPLPGFGMGASGIGELLVSLAPPNPVGKILIGAPWTGPGTPAPVGTPVPADTNLLGETFYAQGGLFDPTSAPGTKIRFSDAVELYIGA
jgi:hypothetical protein